MKIRSKVSILIIVLTAIMLIASCSRAKPEILFGFVKLVLYEDYPYPTEHLSFFVLVDDEDGLENLDTLYIFHDREQLRWRIPNDEWIHHNDDGRNWIGTRSIAVSEGMIPTGVFRAVLVNKGGEYTERNFTFDGSVLFIFPEITVSGDSFIIDSGWPVNRLVGFDRNGNFLTTLELDSLSGNISQLRLSSAVMSVALWAEDENNFTSAFTNAVRIR